MINKIVCFYTIGKDADDKEEEFFYLEWTLYYDETATQKHIDKTVKSDLKELAAKTGMKIHTREFIAK